MRIFILLTLLLTPLLAGGDFIVVHQAVNNGNDIVIVRSESLDSITFNDTTVEVALSTLVKPFEIFIMAQQAYDAENGYLCDNTKDLGLNDNPIFTECEYFSLSVVDTGVVEAVLKESWGDIPKGATVRYKMYGIYSGRDGFDSTLVDSIFNEFREYR